MKKILIAILALASFSQVFAASDLQLGDLWFDNAKAKIYTKICNIGDTMEWSSQINMTFSKLVDPMISKSYVPTLYLLKSQCVDAFMDKVDIQANEWDTVRVNISWAKGETNFSNNTLTRFSNGSLDYSTWYIVNPISSSSNSSKSSTSSSNFSSINSNINLDLYVKEFVVTPSKKDIKITVCNNWIWNKLVQTYLKNVQTGLTFVHNWSWNDCYDIHTSFWEMWINYISWANYDIQVLLNYKKDLFETNYNNNAFNLNIVYNNWSWKWIDPSVISFSTSNNASNDLYIKGITQNWNILTALVCGYDSKTWTWKVANLYDFWNQKFYQSLYFSNGCSEQVFDISNIKLTWVQKLNVTTNYDKILSEKNYENNGYWINVNFSWTSSSSSSLSSKPAYTGWNNTWNLLSNFPTLKKYCRVYNWAIRVCIPYQGAKIKVDRVFNQYQKNIQSLNSDQKIAKINETIIELKAKYPNLKLTSEKLSVEYMLLKLTNLRSVLANETYTFDIKNILN